MARTLVTEAERITLELLVEAFVTTTTFEVEHTEVVDTMEEPKESVDTRMDSASFKAALEEGLQLKLAIARS